MSGRAARINNALEETRFELLLRMRDETGTIVAPDQFIAAAERYGITPSIDRWVFDSAFRWLVSEADERKHLTMCSINLRPLVANPTVSPRIATIVCARNGES